jgi:glycine betaine/proline transport system permease protein
MIGCTQTPDDLARAGAVGASESLMVGMNQVIMLSLNMVIIASMIGAGGLGFDVLAAPETARFRRRAGGGFAIVALAIALDRLSQAYAESRLCHRTSGPQGPRSGVIPT